MTMPDDDRDVYGSAGYLESREFLAYARRIRGIIWAGSRPLSIAQIHRRLGADMKREWTADALDSIRDIEAVGLLPTRYRPLVRLIAGLHKPRNEKFELKPPKPKEPYYQTYSRSA